MERAVAALESCTQGRGAIVVILVVATVVRLVGLGAHDFWYDESLEIERDRLPWPRVLFYARGPDPPLFRLLPHPLAVRTSSETWLRFPSVLFSVAPVWLVWCWVTPSGTAIDEVDFQSREWRRIRGLYPVQLQRGTTSERPLCNGGQIGAGRWTGNS